MLRFTRKLRLLKLRKKFSGIFWNLGSGAFFASDIISQFFTVVMEIPRDFFGVGVAGTSFLISTIFRFSFSYCCTNHHCHSMITAQYDIVGTPADWSANLRPVQQHANKCELAKFATTTYFPMLKPSWWKRCARHSFLKTFIWRGAYFIVPWYAFCVDSVWFTKLTNALAKGVVLIIHPITPPLHLYPSPSEPNPSFVSMNESSRSSQQGTLNVYLSSLSGHL